MSLLPFPISSTARWRRLDVAGWEEASFRRTESGWELSGTLHVEEGPPARLTYGITCDTGWRSLSAVIEGTAGDDQIRFALEADGKGSWICNRAWMPTLEGAVDIDLGFTPATNTLPIRRLELEIGEKAFVTSVWLRFPELRFERLEQTYYREGQHSFRYEAMVDGEPFTARLDTDAFGRVVRYEGLWEMEGEA